MAINPGALYPTQMLPASSPNWPYGEPKNIVTAGDGTGTPWEAEVVKDIRLKSTYFFAACLVTIGT